MFNNLGVQWAGTLLGCLALIMVPIPLAFIRYGPWLRRKSKFAPNLDMKRKESVSMEMEGGTEANV